MSKLTELEFVQKKVNWLKKKKIFPNGTRYLLPDSFGICLYCSLFEVTKSEEYLDSAEQLVESIDKTLKKERGYLNGEEKQQFGQFFNYLSKLLFSFYVLSNYRGEKYLIKAAEVVKEIHPYFLVPKKGMYWRMDENLKKAFKPYKQNPYNFNDSLEGYVVYRLINESLLKLTDTSLTLTKEIEDLEKIIKNTSLDQIVLKTDMQYGMMLWISHFFPDEEFSKYMRYRCKVELKELWHEPNEKCGYFMREIGAIYTYYSFTNSFVGVGLKSCDLWKDKVSKLQLMFRYFRSGDHYDKDPFTIIMLCNLFVSNTLIGFSSNNEEEFERLKNIDLEYSKKMEIEKEKRRKEQKEKDEQEEEKKKKAELELKDDKDEEKEGEEEELKDEKDEENEGEEEEEEDVITE